MWGVDEPFYSYRAGSAVDASRELKLFIRVPTLYLNND